MLLLDLLIFGLVLFPLVSEGFAIDIPGGPLINLPDLGIPLLAVGLILAAAQSRALRAPKFYAHHAARFVESWRGALPRSPRQVARTTLAALAAGGAFYLAWRHWAFDKSGLGPGFVLWRLTRGTGGVLIVALVALALRAGSAEPWENSYFYRAGRKLARAWLDRLTRAPARTLWAACALVAALFFWVAIARHRAFDTHGYDLGIFTNAMWNLTHGSGYFSSVKGGINLFSDHQSPLFWLLAPFFRAVPRPETLLLLQAVGLAAGGPAMYYLGRAKLPAAHWAAAALPWLYWCYLPLRNANAFDFHPEVFMLPLFLWAFVGFGSASRVGKTLGILSLLGALAAKESAGVVAVGLGAAWALTASAESWRKSWPGLALAAAGLAVFLFDVKVVPTFFGTHYAYMGLYERFGGGLGELVLAPFTRPEYFLSQVLNHERVNFLFWTLAPLAFLPLFDWRAALAAVPPYLMLLLSQGDQRVRIVFHYGIEPGTALFWALPLGLAAFASRFGWKAAGLWMLVWATAALGPGELSRIRDYEPTDHARWVIQALPCIDPAAPSAASDVLIPHLATRSWISYPYQLRIAPSGRPVSCVVTDSSLGTWPLLKNELEEVLAGLPREGYRRALSCRGFSLYELAGARCLQCVPAGCY